jgi:hypothetical protein
VLMGILLLSLIGKGALLYLHDTEKKAYNQWAEKALEAVIRQVEKANCEIPIVIGNFSTNEEVWLVDVRCFSSNKNSDGNNAQKSDSNSK